MGIVVFDAENLDYRGKVGCGDSCGSSGPGSRRSRHARSSHYVETIETVPADVLRTYQGDDEDHDPMRTMMTMSQTGGMGAKRW